MKTYEFEVLLFDDELELEDKLNELGKAGFQLVCIFVGRWHYAAVLQREQERTRKSKERTGNEKAEKA